MVVVGIAATQATGGHVGVLHAAIATPGLRALEKLYSESIADRISNILHLGTDTIC